MQSRIPTVVREETEEAVDESDPADSDSDDDSREDEKSLDDIIEAYAE